MIHLNPAWLADAARPLSDHRLRRIVEESPAQGSIFNSWAEKGFFRDREEARNACRKFVEDGIASVKLLRALLEEGVCSKYKICLKELCGLLEEHTLLFPIEKEQTRDASDSTQPPTAEAYVVPFRLKEMPNTIEEDEEQEAREIYQRTGRFTLRFLPPGLMERIIAKLHPLGVWYSYYR